jgi:hypothetical protein
MIQMYLIGNHTRDGDTKMFDINKLKELYGIGMCLIETTFDLNDNNYANNNEHIYDPENDELVENDDKMFLVLFMAMLTSGL